MRGGSGRNERREWEESERKWEEVGGMREGSGRNEMREWEE